MTVQQLALAVGRDTLPTLPPTEAKGVIYTQSWVVDFILDLVGYTADTDLSCVVAFEPAVGRGAFLLPMIRRLLDSASTSGHKVDELKSCIHAFEIDPHAAAFVRKLVVAELVSSGCELELADELANSWLMTDDYLLAVPSAPKADFVVGNPPYIRYDDLSRTAFDIYRGLYPTMRGRCDIYVGFIEAALRQLRPGGICGFICADRWMLNAYGAELRRLVSSGYTVDAVVQMHNAPAFDDDVSAYPAVIIIRRADSGRTLLADAGPRTPTAHGSLAAAVVKAAEGRGDSTGQLPGVRAAFLDSWFQGPDPWPLTSPERMAILKDLESRFPPLEDVVTGTKVGIGVATGADRVFVTQDANAVEADRMLPLAMGADIRSGVLQWSGHYLVDPWDTKGLVNLQDYPRLRAYLEAHEGELRARHIGKANERAWFRTIDRVTHSLVSKPKLLFQDMKLRIHPVLDQGNTYPHHNLYWVTSDQWDMELLGGLMLSRIAELFVEAYCVKMRGGTLRFQAQYLRRIRVPRREDIDAHDATELRQAFSERDEERATSIALRLYGIDSLPDAESHAA
jgi:adenine-specific DNA-methyltransferase